MTFSDGTAEERTHYLYSIRQSAELSIISFIIQYVLYIVIRL